MAHLKKPEKQKTVPVTANNPDTPVPIGQREVLSSMGRTRTGIQNCGDIYGDRKFPCANKC